MNRMLISYWQDASEPDEICFARCPIIGWAPLIQVWRMPDEDLYRTFISQNIIEGGKSYWSKIKFSTPEEGMKHIDDILVQYPHIVLLTKEQTEKLIILR